MFWHSTPPELAEEFIHGYMGDAGAVIDLTPGDGKWAYMALRHRKPYVGIAFTKAHQAALENRLDHLIFNAMQDESDPLFSSGLVELLGKSKDKEGKDKDKDAKKKAKKPAPEENPKEEGKKGAGAGGSARAQLLKRLSGLSGGSGRKPKVAKKERQQKDDDDDDDDEEPEDSEAADSEDD